MIPDFDKDYHRFVHQWVKAHADLSPEQMEDRIPEIYEEWKNTPMPELGVSPRAYFAGMSNQQLLDLVLQEEAPPSVLLDALVERKAEHEALRLLSEPREDLRMLGVNLLMEMDSPLGFQPLFDWLKDPERCEHEIEIALEYLNLDPQRLADQALPLLETFDERTKDLLCDVLVNAAPDERIFSLLMEMAGKNPNLPLYAAYLGRYGDERALPFLQSKIREKSISYPAFLELRNAIERLGGEVGELPAHDFSQDEYYLATHPRKEK